MKKLFLVLILFFIFLFFVFSIYQHLIFLENLPILAYHDVNENPTEETDISIKNFEKQMKYISKHYKTLSMDEFYDWKSGADINGKKVLLTFDDGKESFYTIVVPLLEKYNLKGTIFVIENGVGQEGYLTHEQVEDLKENHPLITVASHSYNLHDETSANSNDYNLYNKDMEKNTENHYTFYAYPFGIMNECYKQALQENHYKLAFLFSPSKWASRQQDNLEITRVPIYKSNSILKFKLKLFIKI